MHTDCSAVGPSFPGEVVIPSEARNRDLTGRGAPLSGRLRFLATLGMTDLSFGTTAIPRLTARDDNGLVGRGGIPLGVDPAVPASSASWQFTRRLGAGCN